MKAAHDSRLDWFGGIPLTIISFALLLTAISSMFHLTELRAQEGNEKTFATPGEAAAALYNAVKAGDQAALSVMFGKSGNEVLHTGDDVADKNAGNDFIRRYEQMRRVVIEPDGTASLYIGAENWPLPIPIAKNNAGQWYFDVETGKTEILNRRIGTNENDAIEVCYTLVDAQLDYFSEARSGESAKHYALKFISDEGKQNGLYWKVSGNEPASPIGPLVADASSEGYNGQRGAPFHGYNYRILTKQGPAAKGGAKNYLVNGQLVRGFAFLASPAQYRVSGVMTFIVNQDGVVYQKDLGPETSSVAAAMTEFNPDDSWDPVDK